MQFFFAEKLWGSELKILIAGSNVPHYLYMKIKLELDIVSTLSSAVRNSMRRSCRGADVK